MEELKIEIDILTKCINCLEDFKKNAVACDNITGEEYTSIHNYEETLNDRLINKKVELEGMNGNEWSEFNKKATVWWRDKSTN